MSDTTVKYQAEYQQGTSDYWHSGIASCDLQSVQETARMLKEFGYPAVRIVEIRTTRRILDE